ncbi:hypothetical protein MMC24_005311 [Lignoscripta atroalba]|nr:hypothetical protein [Lignoscripta atroalba]
MENPQAIQYLQSLLNKQLCLHTSDTRMFVGEFKCTDNECNIILTRTHEYRPPSLAAINAAAAGSVDPPPSSSSSSTSPPKTVKAEMTSRFLGLVVVPGQYITKIEVEDG